MQFEECVKCALPIRVSLWDGSKWVVVLYPDGDLGFYHTLCYTEVETNLGCDVRGVIKH